MKRSFVVRVVAYMSLIVFLAVSFVNMPLPAAQAIQGDLWAHDPSMIKQGNTYYLFATGGGIQIRTSTDLVNWRRTGSVFTTIPSWVKQKVGNITDLWAPDITYANGKYHLYYAGSTFGTNTSVIGLVTNVTLNPSDPNYRWEDQGLVIESRASDNFNAIDANLAFDTNSKPWLSFGSFWSGIKMRRLDPKTLKLTPNNTTLYSLAARPGSTAIEAPDIIYRNGYYYLFASIDSCCRGSNSTYKIVVGRSTNITGPYVNKNGQSMMQGNYTLLLQGSGNMRGPGGQSIYQDGSRSLLVHHYYDSNQNGAIKFYIRELIWGNDGWPQVSNPIS